MQHNMYMYTCIYAYIHVCTQHRVLSLVHICMYTHTHTTSHTCVYVHVHTQATHTHEHIHMHVIVYTCTHKLQNDCWQYYIHKYNTNMGYYYGTYKFLLHTFYSSSNVEESILLDDHIKAQRDYTDNDITTSIRPMSPEWSQPSSSIASAVFSQLLR